WRDGRGERELDPDDELALEDAERLIDASLAQVDWVGPDDLSDRHSGRRIHRQRDRDEIGVAGFVRVRVVALGQADAENSLRGTASMDAVSGDDRNELGGRRARELSLDVGRALKDRGNDQPEGNGDTRHHG